MQKLSLQSEMFFRPEIFRVYSIFFIPENWMADICHMDTDLMCSSSFKSYFNQCQFFSFILEDFHYFVVSCCFPSFKRILYRHLESIIRVTTDDRLDCSDMIFWFSDDESEIGLLHLMVIDELLKFSKSDIVFGHEKKPTRFFVEAVNYTWPIFSHFTVKILDLCDELIYHRAKTTLIAWCRMGVDACIFADNEKIIVLKNYLQWTMVRGERGGDSSDIHFYSVTFFEIVFGV